MKSLEISQKFYDMFFSDTREISLKDYLDGSLCDEVGDINLEKDNFKSVYHFDGKYFVPVTDGTYTSLYHYIINNAVHPDDLETFKLLMDPEFMKERQESSKTPHFRFAQFRYKLNNGVWRWVEQCVLSGEENDLPDNVYRFYIFDIENMLQKEYGNTSISDTLVQEEKNSLTGLYNEKFFNVIAQKIVDDENNNNICLLKLDIEHFKLFDEWYGRDSGNKLLEKIGKILTEYQKENTVAGYLGQDDFCMVLPYNRNIVDEILEKVKAEITSFGFSFGFAPAIGIVIVNHEDDVTYAFDKATIAASIAKKDPKNRVVIYDPGLHTKTDLEFKTISKFMRALQNDRIIFYLQPQCRISTKNIVGAEVLTRWVDENGSIIPPIEFIPTLEKYGFITDLDKYIWEKACKWIRKRLDEGHKIVPISVNVSQVDIYNIDIVEFFESLIKKYNIPSHLLKIEITESAFAEDTELVTNIINRLRKKGYLIMMDDFGSGYSSLNMLSNISFDVVKLDSTFLKTSNDIQSYHKTINVLESIVNMAKLISVPIIVEGVERTDQVEFLESLGVRYIQGYYFYKPMPVEEYEKITDDENNLDFRGYVMKANEQFRTRELLDQSIYSDAMLNTVLGPVAIYSKKGKHVDIIRFNQQFYEAVGVPDFAERLVNIEQFVPEFDRKKFLEMFDDAKQNHLQGATCVTRFGTITGNLLTFFLRVFYLGEQDGASRFYGSASNITNLATLQQQMRLIAKYASSSIAFFKIVKDDYIGLHFTVVAHGLENSLCMDKQQFEDELNNGRLYRRVDQKKLKHIQKLIFGAVKKKEPYRFSFELKRDDGEMVEIYVKGDPILDDPITGYNYIVSFSAKDVKEIN